MRVHRAAGTGSRATTATPGGGWPSPRVLTGKRPATAARGRSAPTEADTGPPATRGIAALTPGGAPSAPMGTAGPPAPAPCLGAQAAPEVVLLSTTRPLSAPPLGPGARDTLRLAWQGAAPTAAAAPAAPHPHPTCLSTPASEQSSAGGRRSAKLPRRRQRQQPLLALAVAPCLPS